MLHGDQRSAELVRAWVAVVSFWVCFFCLVPLSGEARVWYSGVVTATAEIARGKIEVDEIRFTIMPDAKLQREYEVGDREFQVRRMAPAGLSAGNRVRMLIEGHRVYQLVREQ